LSKSKVSPARDGALRVLLAVEKNGAYANLEMQKNARRWKLAASDTAFFN
jgi:16S rRNA (cytosine967-C5)-methyltransferase